MHVSADDSCHKLAQYINQPTAPKRILFRSANSTSRNMIPPVNFLLLLTLTCLASGSRTPVTLSTKQPWNDASGTRGGSQAAAIVAPRTMSAGQMKILNFFSGGVAGTIASCLTNPLEVVKTQLQSSSTAVASNGELALARACPMAISKNILANDGIAGFFRGIRPTLFGIIPARSAYFYAYEQTKRRLSPVLPVGSIGNAIISGLAAGVTSNTLTNPIWMVKTRMQLVADGSAGQRVYTGYRDVVGTIAREEGVAGFYKGVSASYWGCVEGSIQFVIYEKIKKNLLRRQNEQRVRQGLEPIDRLPKLTYFMSAAVAKGVASSAAYPHEVARTRMREQARSGVFKYSGMWNTLRLIAKEEGTRGLYAGMGMHLVKVVPNSAIMFLTYELVNSWLSQFTPAEN